MNYRGQARDGHIREWISKEEGDLQFFQFYALWHMSILGKTAYKTQNPATGMGL